MKTYRIHLIQRIFLIILLFISLIFPTAAEDHEEWILTNIILVNTTETHNDCYDQKKTISANSSTFFSKNLQCKGMTHDPDDWSSSAWWEIPPNTLIPGEKVHVSGGIVRNSDTPELFQDDHLIIGFDGPGCYGWKTSCPPYYDERVTGEVQSSRMCAENCRGSSIAGDLFIPGEGDEIVLQYETNAGVVSYVYTRSAQKENIILNSRNSTENQTVVSSEYTPGEEKTLYPNDNSYSAREKNQNLSQPVNNVSVSCNCDTYDITSESVDCLFKGKGCSNCHEFCISRRNNFQPVSLVSECNQETEESVPPCTIPLNSSRHYYGPIKPGNEVRILYPADIYTLWYAEMPIMTGNSTDVCDSSWTWKTISDVEIAIDSSLIINFAHNDSKSSPDELAWHYENVSLGNNFGEIRFIVEKESKFQYSAILCPQGARNLESVHTICDCSDYHVSDESSECLNLGKGCSACHDNCIIRKEGNEPDNPVDTSDSGCDCNTYEFSEESLDCMLKGNGCSACYYECTGKTEESESINPVPTVNSTCDCTTFDSSNETIGCLGEYRGCSECFLECMWGLEPKK